MRGEESVCSQSVRCQSKTGCEKPLCGKKSLRAQDHKRAVSSSLFINVNLEGAWWCSKRRQANDCTT